MLFNNSWFIQVLSERILKNGDNKSLINLFYVNKKCYEFKKAHCKYAIYVGDDSGMPIYAVNYIYNTYQSALEDLENVMNKNNVESDFWDLTFRINYIYTIPTENSWFKFINDNKTYFNPIILKHKSKILYHEKN